MQALVRRERREVAPNLLTVADLQLDPARQEVRREGQLLKLSPTAFRILRILMRESPKVVSREQLEHELWGDLVPDSDAPHRVMSVRPPCGPGIAGTEWRRHSRAMR